MTESDLLTLLLEQSNLYIGHGSVEEINAFFNGHRNAVKMEADPIYRGFGKWLRKRLRINRDVGWLTVICYFGLGDAGTFNFAREMWAKYLGEIYGSGTREIQEHKDGILTQIGELKPSELFNEILERPVFYTGYESVILTKAFMDGYQCANHLSRNSREDPLYSGFQNWVAKRFHIITTHDWAHIITFIGISESGAFTLMKELWKQYSSETGME